MPDGICIVDRLPLQVAECKREMLLRKDAAQSNEREREKKITSRSESNKVRARWEPSCASKRESRRKEGRETCRR